MGVGQSQGVYLRRATQTRKEQTSKLSLSVVRTRGPNVPALEDNTHPTASARALAVSTPSSKQSVDLSFRQTGREYSTPPVSHLDILTQAVAFS
jgi:hypothetical protein